MSDCADSPRPGSSSRLSVDGNTHTLKHKDATTLTLDANGNLSTFVAPSGVTATIAYDRSAPPLPTGVSSGHGLTSALAWNGAKQLTAVTDNTGRSVSFAYDGNGNLASVVDALDFASVRTAYPTNRQGSPMKAPSEFNVLCQFFHQDVLRLFPSLEVAAVESVMSLTKAQRPIVRDVLERVLASDRSDEDVEELWRQSPAQIGFSEPRGVRSLLELVRDALDTQLARDAQRIEK